jgi:hypothetical protein
VNFAKAFHLLPPSRNMRASRRTGEATMTEQTAANDHQLTGGDPRAAQLLESWRQLDERYQEVVMATASALAAFVQFRRVDAETRALIRRLLDDPSDTELRALHEHPDGAALSEWLLSLPSYLDADEESDGADDEPESADEIARAEPPASVDLRGDVSRLFHRTPSG